MYLPLVLRGIDGIGYFSEGEAKPSLTVVKDGRVEECLQRNGSIVFAKYINRD